MKKILILAVLLIGFSSFQIQAQKNLSLSDAIQIGLENNFQIKISGLNVEKSRINNSWGTAGRYPTITLGANLNNRFDNMPDPMGSSTDRLETYTHTLYPNANLRWTIFGGFRVNIAKDKLELLQQFSEGNEQVVIENTIQAIILAYYKVQLENEKLSVLKSLKDISRDRYDYVMQKKEFGSSVTYDVLQAKNAYLSDSSSYLFQQLNLKNANLNLNLLLGEKESTRFELTEKLSVVANNYMLGDLMDRMLANNKTIKNQYINQEILKKEIDFQKGAVLPSLMFNSGFDHFNTMNRMKGSSEKTYTNNYDFYANLSLSFNLSDGGNARSAIQLAKIDERIGELSIAEIELQLKNVLINLFDLYSIHKQLYDVSEANLESAKLNLQISQDKFKVGAINSFNYRDIQMLYLNAAIQQYESIYNLMDTHTELLRLTGGIIEAN